MRDIDEAASSGPINLAEIVVTPPTVPLDSREPKISDDGIDEIDPSPEQPDAPKKFRLEQQDLFKTLVLENAAKIDEQQEQRRQKRVTGGKVDDGLTIEQLMNEQGKAALNDPREYQLALFERAKAENTIAVLETGSGKTLIAVLLIRHVVDRELEDRAKGMPHRTTFFMVRMSYVNQWTIY